MSFSIYSPRKLNCYGMMIHLVYHSYMWNFPYSSFIYHWHDTDSFAKWTLKKKIQINACEVEYLQHMLTALSAPHKSEVTMFQWILCVRLKSVSFGTEICQTNYQAQTSKTFRPGKMTLKQNRHILMCNLRDNRVVSMVMAIHKEQIVKSKTAEAS